MKFLAWFFAVIIFFSGLLMVNIYNFHQSFFNPEATKKALSDTDFYAQMKAALKKGLFESEEGKSADAAAISKTFGSTFDAYNFQPKVEKIIDDFYRGLENRDGFKLEIDLREYKTLIADQLAEQVSAGEIENSNVPIPDQYQVDVSNYSGFLHAVGFVYRNFNIILIVYLAMILLFFLFCVLVNYKYLRLFFIVTLILGVFVLIEYILFSVINPKSMLASITDQGGSGVEVATLNFLEYFKVHNIKLLFWESIPAIILSVIALIIIAVIPTKSSNIPLTDNK